MIEIIWNGRGGQGAFSASKILGAAVVEEGGYALSFPSFGPERRGAPIQAYTKIGKEKISDRSVIEEADYIVYLDETLFQQEILATLKPSQTVYLNTKNPEKYVDAQKIVAVNADKIAEEVLGRAVSNTAMLALLARETGIASKASIKKVLSDYLPPKIAKRNELIIDRM